METVFIKTEKVIDEGRVTVFKLIDLPSVFNLNEMCVNDVPYSRNSDY